MRIKKFDFELRINNRKIFVEFDGYMHYTNANQIYKDNEYSEIAKKHGYEVIKIPYFLQLDTEIFQTLFNVDLKNTTILTNYKSGFWSYCTNVASFCSLGLNLFKKQINSLPNYALQEIYDSFYWQSINNKMDMIYIVPNELDIHEFQNYKCDVEHLSFSK